jgi:CheY-like chemotaxis protein
MHRQLSCGIDLLSNFWDFYFVPHANQLITAALMLRPHLILLNAYDPSVHGFEACRRLRNIPQLHSTPVVLVMQQEDRMFHSLARQLRRTAIMEAPVGGMHMLQQLQALVSSP